MKRASLGAVVFFACASACTAPPEIVDEFENLGALDNRFIVVLAEDAGELPESIAARHQLTTDFVYKSAPRSGAFAAVLTSRSYAELLSDPSVAFVAPDLLVSYNAQTVPTGIARIRGDINPVADLDGTHVELDIDIAILDTGVMIGHEDLNIAGGVNFSNGPSDKYEDGDGHGTHVSGTAAAMDNTVGVVGVAPGARIWALRVLDNRGTAPTSTIVAGIDWVAARGPTAPSPIMGEPVIKVANMSLGGSCSGACDDGNCGIDNGNAMHVAICDAVNVSGVTFVVAAGNDYQDAKFHQPAAFDEVITVSALSDGDGAPGGDGTIDCRTDADDTFANFSNFGDDVDIMAPGVCIYSTYDPGGGPFVPYATLSGTSMASPHVAGAAALYLLKHPDATPAEVKAGLIEWARPYEMCALSGGGLGDCDQDDPDMTPGDPDGTQEPLLYVGVLDESFEGYDFGTDPAGYINLSGGDASVVTTSSSSSDGAESAVLSGIDDAASVKFCLPGGTTAGTHVRARFSLRFPTGFVDWNPLIISGVTSPLLYWYWVGSTGAVTEDAVVGTIPSPGAWQEVVIDIDRRSGVEQATFDLMGVSSAITSLSVWDGVTPSTEAMDCLVVSTWPPNGQDLEIDDVTVLSWD